LQGYQGEAEDERDDRDNRAHDPDQQVPGIVLGALE